MKLQDRRAIVTGGGRGIGRAYVERLLDEGAKVAIFDVDMASADQTVADLSGRGDLFALRTDVADVEQVEANVAEAADRLGGLDILINNAALFGDMEHDQSYEYLKKMYDVNLMSLWLMTRAAAPRLIESDHGRVINQSSTVAWKVTPMGDGGDFPGLMSFGYNWTKWGVNGLTKFSAAQLGNWGVTVNAIAPGPTHSQAFLDQVPSEEHARALMAQQPVKGAIQPEDIAGAAAFLASDDARFINGQVIIIDGGRFMPW
jgi:NAD(P)-dependent dehydrogenase (short-subunit alcohol dehydrogenase family)